MFFYLFLSTCRSLPANYLPPSPHIFSSPNLPPTLRCHRISPSPPPPSNRAHRANRDLTLTLSFPPHNSNGGRDVFVDIGDKSWGVNVCQRYFEQQDAAAAASSSSSSSSGHRRGAAPLTIRPENTLHVGDQFLSAGANDFRARSVGTTAWIASPEETVELLDELADLMGKKMA